MSIDFEPMRSLIYTDVVKEEYRHKLLHWHVYHHVEESISQFGPYVTKYAFYPAMPTPSEGERFGTVRFHMTEHYWLINPFQELLKNKAFTEFFPPDVMKWQGTIPDIEDGPTGNMDGDAARATGGKDMPPFLFVFLPLCWEDDLKGAGRTAVDGPNYRWSWTVACPEGISEKDFDDWMFGTVLPVFEKNPLVNRILTSKVKREVNGTPFHRVVEMWFDGPEEWHKAAVEGTKSLEKPAWATQDAFPFLRPGFECKSVFLPDIPYRDNLVQHNGWITMR